MGNHTGSEGIVKIGSNVVAEIRSYSLDENMSPIEDTVMGDTDKTFKSGLKDWNGSLTCFWDETDTSGQGAMTNAALVTLNLYPEGDQSTDTYKTGAALITNVHIEAAHDGMVECSFDYQGTGALTEMTVA